MGATNLPFDFASLAMNLPGRIAVLALFAAPSVTTASSLYVDKGLASSCSNYDVSTRSCGNGTDQAFSDLDAGLSALNAGDVLFLRGGSYSQLIIQRAGTPTQPISIRGFAGESAIISGSGGLGIRVIGQSDVIFRDLVVTGVQGFGRIENSSRVRFDSIDFSNAGSSGTTGSLKFVRSSHNVVLNSSFRDGSDLLILQDASDFNVIQDNTFGATSHSQVSIRCSSNNVIRSNQFDNPDQKSMEIYDCEGISDAPVRLDDTKSNLVELNRFFGTAPSSRSHDYNAIQHGGQRNIVRLNVFTDNLGGGVNYQVYSQESLHVYENRLYNNTFYNNRCYGVLGSSSQSSDFYDNRVVNNLLYQNTDCSGGNGQTLVQNPNSVILTNNSLENSDPGFSDAANRDLSLLPGSSQIDIGAFVTTAISDGSGTSLVVDDAGWFYDGFGITGESGDEIRLQGQSASVRIMAIDYATNTITLSASQNWNSGDGVHLNYSGNSPDAGAFEFGSSVETRPMPPTNLTVD